jgi:hypothetical protein
MNIGFRLPCRSLRSRLSTLATLVSDHVITQTKHVGTAAPVQQLQPSGARTSSGAAGDIVSVSCCCPAPFHMCLITSACCRLTRSCQALWYDSCDPPCCHVLCSCIAFPSQSLLSNTVGDTDGIPNRSVSQETEGSIALPLLLFWCTASLAPAGT